MLLFHPNTCRLHRGIYIYYVFLLNEQDDSLKKTFVEKEKEIFRLTYYYFFFFVFFICLIEEQFYMYIIELNTYVQMSLSKILR
jgi:hypothetical protein